ncbi:putative replication stress response regulator SDE2 [Cocos nucifera]|nr:putative replication stress response regulator SDE2 [Cocos nucifera]
MAIYQIFVKLLDGRTQCLQISSPTVSGETLKCDLFARTKIPLRFQRLVAGSREVLDETLISASPDGLFPSCSLLLRLRGGKGGFGSLLRGAATKAGQKKTNNFDACRDMSGRRLRHVNAEKKLEEWKAEAEERKLEKLAEDFLKKKAKEVKKNSTVAVEKYLEKYRQDTEKCMEEVEESVRQSFGLYKESKRKILPTSDPSNKRLKIWLGKQKVDESDSDDDEEDDEDAGSDFGDEKSVVLDDGNANCSRPNTVEEGTLASGSNSDGESSGGGSAQSNLEEVNGNSDLESPVVEPGSGSGHSNSESEDTVDNEMGVPEETAAQNTSVASTLHEVQNGVISGSEGVPESVEFKVEVEKPVEAKTVDRSTCVGLEEPLNFDKYNSAVELEVLGMERLKSELQARGLKCGGTLQERASRLFLLKKTPVDKLPKKVVELWTKRKFKCDCGNSKFGVFVCKLWPNKDPENGENSYNQNFKGSYCTCGRPYPDPDSEEQTEMIQCCICEDWFHENHLGLDSLEQIPRDEEGEPLYDEFICQECAVSCCFLKLYPISILASSNQKATPVHAESGTVSGDKDGENAKKEPIIEKDNACNQSSSSTCILGIDINSKPVIFEKKNPMFLSKSWRNHLCRCSTCCDYYTQSGIGYLIDKEDSLEEYEKMAKQKREEKLQQQEGAQLNFLNTLGHVQKMEILNGIADMKNEFRSFLESVDTSKPVTTEDVQGIFENLVKKKKQRLLCV